MPGIGSTKIGVPWQKTLIGLPADLLAKFLFLWTGRYVGDDLRNELDSDVITVTGKDWTGKTIPQTTAATFATPNNATYLAADGTDDWWFNGAGVLQQKTHADLIISTTMRTFIKYNDFDPYYVSAIGILKDGEVITEAEKIILNRFFKLWVQYWGPEMMLSGYMKDNRTFIESAVELTFDDIANAPITAAYTVSDWNTIFGLPANGTPFTEVVVDGDTIKLYGGSNIIFDVNYAFIFNEETNHHLVEVIDNAGCIIQLNESVFGAGPGGNVSAIQVINLPACTTMPESYTFQDVSTVTDLYIPLCTTIGSTTEENNVFFGFVGQTITLTIPASLMTCNGGNPDGDIATLQANNTLTIIQV